MFVTDEMRIEKAIDSLKPKEIRSAYELICSVIDGFGDTIDPGPDNVSTQEDIAETNELESLRSMREEIQELLELKRWDNDKSREWNFCKALNDIERTVNPRS